MTSATCSPSGSATWTDHRPRATSNHYRYNGECRAFDDVNAGTLNGTPLRYKSSIHGPVIATATIDGKFYRPLAQAVDVRARRAQPGRAQGHDRGQGLDTAEVLERRQPVRLHVQLGLRVAQDHGVLHLRPPAQALGRGSTAVCRRSATATSSGAASSARTSIRTTSAAPTALLLNWNNRSAPGFMHGDDEPYGSVHRVELFDRFPFSVKLPDVVERHEPRGNGGRALAGLAGHQPRAAQDARRPVSATARSSICSTTGCRATPRGSTRTTTGYYDEPSPAIMDALFKPLAQTVLHGRLGDLVDDVDSVRGLGGLSGESYVDKDLRTLLGDDVKGRFNLTLLRRRLAHPLQQLAVVHAPRRRGQAGRAVRRPGSGEVAGHRVPDRIPAGADPEHDEDHEPPDVPAGARVPGSALGCRRQTPVT